MSEAKAAEPTNGDIDPEQAQELKELDDAWGDWREETDDLSSVDGVKDNLEGPMASRTEQEQDDVFLEEASDDVEPGGTPGI